MSRIEDIDTGMWSDPDFEALSRDASLLLIWSWTNPKCGMAGLYKVSRRAMLESKVTAEDLDQALTELAEARMAFYEDNVLFIRARAKRLRQKTRQIAKSIAKDLGKIAPDHPLRQMFMHEYGATPWLLEALATLTGPSGDPHGGITTSTIPSQIPGPSLEGHPTLHGKGNGNGKGTGKGTGNRGGAGERAFWARWAEQHLPEIPSTFVIAAALALADRHPDREVTADAVRARLAATHPHVVATTGAAA